MKNTLLLILLPPTLFFPSCSMTKYFPTPVQTPLLTEKNELKVTTSMPGDISVAYAPDKNIGLFSNISFYNESQPSSTTINGNKEENEKNGHHLVFEAGAGYFRKYEQNLLFELYGGVGLGRFKIDSKFTNDPINYNYQIPTYKFFINPSFGIKKKYVELAFSMRLTALNFGKSTTNFNGEMIEVDELGNLDHQTTFFYEPSFTVRAGLQPVKFHYQLGYSRKYGNKSLNYMPIFSTLGITIDITPNLFKTLKAAK
ncbi:hypothetical protein [Solitalea lacus]|uniref:hypothetical protein n=1 Tax=Solitalea lacus TaxID=2911172 RepID=UPI001EDBA805|nr:hypothetical protein [Solitalea lacus]UKJ08457.1 hypothetical protein L2B55_04635 [Solitalea lacus]